MILLKLRIGTDVGERSYADEAISLGRSSTCHVVISERRVSRLHARIESVAGEVRLLDQKSGNGTVLNGRRIESHALMVGDTIRIGSTILTVMSLEATGFAPGRTATAVPVYNGDTTVANAEALPKRLRLSPRRRLPRLIRSS